MKTVLSFGETLWDLLPSGPVLGGAPCNFAYRVHSLGDRGVLVTRLGRDALGERAFDALRRLGMETDFVQWDDARPTGTVPVRLDSNGVPDFTITPDVAFDFIEASAGLLDLAGRADGVCFGSLIQRSPGSRETLYRVLDAAPQALKFLDINLRKGCFVRDTLQASLERADVLKLNDDEAARIAREFGLKGSGVRETAEAILRAWSLDCCVVTLGERGAYAVTAGDRAYVPGWKVAVVDTVGSGDAFSAGFVHRYLQGRPLSECCHFGNLLGALVASKAGATGEVTRDEMARFLAADPRPQEAEGFSG